MLNQRMLGQLYAAARGTRAYPFIATAAASGARRGELCALTWDDVDFDRARLSAIESLAQDARERPVGEVSRIGQATLFLDEFALEITFGKELVTDNPVSRAKCLDIAIFLGGTPSVLAPQALTAGYYPGSSHLSMGNFIAMYLLSSCWAMSVP